MSWTPEGLLIELMGPIVYVQLHNEQQGRWQALWEASAENELDKDGGDLVDEVSPVMIVLPF